MAGVALGDIDMHFACQAWQWAGSAGAWVPCVAVDAAAVYVAGVALGDIDLHFVLHAWQLGT